MSYFAAVLARDDDGWVAAEVDLDEADSLDDVAEQARKALEDEDPEVDDDLMVVLLEQRDEWFGVVRVDLDEDPRVFVSNAAAALRHALGETLLPELVGPPVDVDEVAVVDVGVAEVADDDGDVDVDVDDREGSDPVLAAVAGAGVDVVSHPSGPVGDAGLLSDLGLGPETLLALASSGESPPSAVLDDLAESLGVAAAFESVR